MQLNGCFGTDLRPDSFIKDVRPTFSFHSLGQKDKELCGRRSILEFISRLRFKFGILEHVDQSFDFAIVRHPEFGQKRSCRN